MCNERLYRFWGELTEALKTGEPQNEVKLTGKSFYEGLYSDHGRLEQFMHAMASQGAGSCDALAQQFDFSRYKTVCDAGGATANSVWFSRAATRISAARPTICRW